MSAPFVPMARTSCRCGQVGEPGRDERASAGHLHRVDAVRMLATVLFTDIVSSTETDVRVGVHRWRELLDQHDNVAMRRIARHRGRLVKTTGDGLLATFDGPARAITCAQEISLGAKP